MVLTLCILAIIVSIAIGWKFKFNTGIIAMGFAFLLGFFGLGMKINDIIAFWPTTIVFYLLSISLFFTYATQNGTMDVLGRKMLYALGGNAKLIRSLSHLSVLSLVALAQVLPPRLSLDRLPLPWRFLPVSIRLWLPSVLVLVT